MSNKTAHTDSGFQLVMSNGQPTEILIDGMISRWTEANSKDFREAFNLLSKGGKDVVVRIGVSGGGSMFEGFAMATTMRQSKSKVITIVESMAASMAGVLFMAGDERRIAKSAMIMTHPPSGMVRGSSDQIRSYASMMDKLEQNVVDLFVNQTGKSSEDVKKWFVKGEDKWHDSSESLENGMATEVFDSGKEMPKQVLDALASDPSSALEVYSNLKKDNSNLNMKNVTMSVVLLAAMFDLPENASETDVTNAIQALKDENKSLKIKLKAFQDAENQAKTAEAEQLTDELIKQKKIPAHLKDVQLKAFELDHEKAVADAKNLLKEAPEGGQKSEGTATPEAVANYLEGLNGQGGKGGKKKFEDYSDAELDEMEKNDPEAFAKLVEGYEGRTFNQ